jgi:OOP family OmpA-OmpF porin
MWNPGRWWVGLIPVLVLALASLYFLQDGIETDILTRAREAAEQKAGTFDGKGWVDASVSGRDVTIAGRAPSEDAIASALAAAQSQWGVRQADSKAALIPPVDVFKWSAQTSKDKVTLGGMVSGDGSRSAVVAAAQKAFPNAKIEDTMLAVRGAPPEFPGWAERILAVLPTIGGSASLSGKALSISGAAKDGPTYETALRSLAAIPNGPDVSAFAVGLPAAPDFNITATKDGTHWRVTGYAHDPDMRAQIFRAARAASGSGNVDGNLELASGGQNGLDNLKAAAFAFAFLKDLQSGTVSVRDGQLSIAGEAPSAEARRALLARFNGLYPGGLGPGTAEIKAPIISPYLVSASRDGKDLTLAGYVPSDGTRKELVDLVEKRFPGFTVKDTLVLGEGAPRQMLAALNTGLQLLSRLSTGKLSLSGANVVLEGEALHPQAAEQIKAQIAAALPVGYVGSGTIGVAPAEPIDTASCQNEIKEQLALRSVNFGTASSTIDAESVGLLDAVVGALRRCPATRITISGHTDSVGAPDVNLDLSQRRADAVADYLVAAGIDAKRIKTAGFGATKAVVSNDTEENRSRNRRIEIDLTEIQEPNQ